MPTTVVVSQDFDRELKKLLQLKAKVAELLQPAVARYLEFAQEYWRLYTSVEGNRRLVDRLQSTLGVSQDYQHQRLRRIAEQSKVLLPLKNALPAAVEPLYEVALVAARDGGIKRLHDAVKHDRLTPESGIRDIRALKLSHHRTGGKNALARITHGSAVRLELSGGTEAHIAEALAALLEADAALTVQTDSQSLVDATKEALATRYDAQNVGGLLPGEPPWNVASAFRQLDKGEKVSGTRADDVTKNARHLFHSPRVPNATLAARLKAHAEEKRWLVPELGLTREFYTPDLMDRQRRISTR